MTMIYFVKTWPPEEVRLGQCPVQEKYKYNWEPIALKYLAYTLKEHFKDQIDVKIWHLMEPKEVEVFYQSIQIDQPKLVAFTEIDLLIPSMLEVGSSIKKIQPDSTLLCGGKHSSLLQKGDGYPFPGIDFALSGDGVLPLRQVVLALLEGRNPRELPGIICPDEAGIISVSPNIHPREVLENLDGKEAVALRSLPVEGHSMEDYIQLFQPSRGDLSVATAPVFSGSGCRYSCSFCQSAVEFGASGRKLLFRNCKSTATEMAWLYKKHSVRDFFFLEPNLDLEHLNQTLENLWNMGIYNFTCSGFIRAGDVTEAEKSGLLEKCQKKGLKALSIGLDIPLGHNANTPKGQDVYKKGFTQNQMLECLDICKNRGILTHVTVVGDPGLTRVEFESQLAIIETLPVTSVDIRLAIALRNTPFYREHRDNLLYKVEEGEAYFKRQNYRYQTIQVPGKITPSETYQCIKDFQSRFGNPKKPLADYDTVAKMYESVFSRFSVRYREWKWLSQRLKSEDILLDVGCGNGAFLRESSPRIALGFGIDISDGMIEKAKSQSKDLSNLQFIRSTELLKEFPSEYKGKVSVISSVLSFRYLPQEKFLQEAPQLLAPGGRVFILDMVSYKKTVFDLPGILWDKIQLTIHHWFHPQYAKTLRNMVQSGDWKAMVEKNPIQTEAHYKTLFGRYFPKGRFYTLNLGWKAKIIAFDSGKLGVEHGKI